MKKITPLFALLFVFSCSEPEIPSHLLMDNGGVFYEVGKKTPFNGITVENKDGEIYKKTFYSDGKMYEEIEFYSSGSTKKVLQKNGNNILVSMYDKEGLDISNSEIVDYYDNGFVKESGRYLNGVKDGRWEYFHEDGELIKREYWSNKKKLPIIAFDNLVVEDKKFYAIDASNDYISKRKPYTGMVEYNNYRGTNYIKVANGSIANLAETYNETGDLIAKSTCISENINVDEMRFHKLSAFNCSRISIYKPIEGGDEETTKETVTKLGDGLWEYKYEIAINNKVRYIEKREHKVSKGEILDYELGKLTFESAVYENGNIHTTTSFVNEEIEFKRYNKDGLDISNGEELGTMAWGVTSLDSIYLQRGKFNKGKPHGAWTNSQGDMTTYKNGIANGPFKQFYSNNCLWKEGNYVDGRREGELITYVSSPRESCGKVIEKVEVYYKGELKE